MRRYLISLCLIAMFASQASAALVYNLAFSSTSVDLIAGQSTSVNVIFQEVAAVGDTRRFDIAGGVNGLTSANFAVGKSGAGSSSITAASGNALFDFGPTVAVGNPTTVTQAILANAPVFGTDSGNIRSVIIGSVMISAAGAVGTQSTFSLQDFLVGNDDILLDDGFGNGANFAADGSLNYGSLNVNIVAVPEPSSALLLCCGILGISMARRRSW